MTHTTIPTLGTAALSISGSTRDLAITPDGTRVVYAGNNATVFVSALDQLDPVGLSSANGQSGIRVAQWPVGWFRRPRLRPVQSGDFGRPAGEDRPLDRRQGVRGNVG